MAEAIKYAVTCCKGTHEWIDDNRPVGGPVVIDPENSFRVKTARLHCEECELAVNLGTRKLGDLLDAIHELQKVTSYDTSEGRRVIPLALLCTVNGRLRRGITAPRRGDIPN